MVFHEILHHFIITSTQFNIHVGIFEVQHFDSKFSSLLDPRIVRNNRYADCDKLHVSEIFIYHNIYESFWIDKDFGIRVS